VFRVIGDNFVGERRVLRWLRDKNHAMTSTTRRAPGFMW